jgi:hypothetical protein
MCEDVKICVEMREDWIYRCKDKKIRGFKEIKKYSRPPLLEEPFAQTLSRIKTKQATMQQKKKCTKNEKMA